MQGPVAKLMEKKVKKDLCLWYLLCENPATTTRSHPILGAVPICERCNEKAQRLEELTKTPAN